MRPPTKTALFAAATGWHAESVAAILAMAPGLVTATDPQGRTALHMACGATASASAKPTA